jgi:hypothetical protein
MYENALDARLNTKIEAIQQTFSNTDGSTIPHIIPGQQQIPEQIKKLKTFNTIPSHLYSVFPSHLEINFDTTPVEREINPSHERIKRVQFKREIENSIQQVAEISAAAPSNMEEGVPPAKVEE